jgi:tetratricopeptide (TPR) repeat protein
MFLDNINNHVRDLAEEKLQTSYEMTILCKAFQDLIQTVQFNKGTILLSDDPDAMSLVNYAELYMMFKEAKNIEAAGICLNNIGNIHYSNKKYDLAVKSYKEAVDMAIINQNKFENDVAKVKHYH